MSVLYSGNEKSRLLALLVITISAEIFLLGGKVMFPLLYASAEWPVAAHLFAMMLPRFVTMALLVALFGPLREWQYFGVFLALYTVLLLMCFLQLEIFVDWRFMTAIRWTLLPYASGLAGALFGFWIRRNVVLHPA